MVPTATGSNKGPLEVCNYSKAQLLSPNDREDEDQGLSGVG